MFSAFWVILIWRSWKFILDNALSSNLIVLCWKSSRSHILAFQCTEWQWTYSMNIKIGAYSCIFILEECFFWLLLGIHQLERPFQSISQRKFPEIWLEWWSFSIHEMCTLVMWSEVVSISNKLSIRMLQIIFMVRSLHKPKDEVLPEWILFHVFSAEKLF